MNSSFTSGFGFVVQLQSSVGVEGVLLTHHFSIRWRIENSAVREIAVVVVKGPKNPSRIAHSSAPSRKK
jgi:hypothetical protein